ncbi:SlyX family protein [Oceanisphaera avium]|uniref:Protein SlyX homolog n=1 Tax=Oceanisphaera avium TaxID=1903694 RepID=A0A1Y0CY73_9GAMM|nr:SlyX family protein [Oceanisphaera avium]ART79974.1 lysis protein [Oceanisphaera avium]
MNSEILARLEQLETRLAFQDDTIEQLHQELSAQGAHTAKLQAQLTIMVERLKDMQPASSSSQADERPPHY